MGQGGLVDLQHVHGKTPLAHPPDQKTRPTPLVTTAASPLKAHPFGFQLNASCLSFKKTHTLSVLKLFFVMERRTDQTIWPGTLIKMLTGLILCVSLTAAKYARRKGVARRTKGPERRGRNMCV